MGKKHDEPQASYPSDRRQWSDIEWQRLVDSHKEEPEPDCQDCDNSKTGVCSFHGYAARNASTRGRQVHRW